MAIAHIPNFPPNTTPTNQIYEKYLVKNTTVKERKRYVEKLNGRWYSITAPFNGYIKGKCEIDEGFKLICRAYKLRFYHSSQTTKQSIQGV